MALVNSLFLAGCASVRGPARLARLQEAPAVEPANQSWDAVVAVPAGSSLQVDLRTGDSIEGRFDSADDQELILEQKGSLHRVPRAEIRRVVINGGRQAGTGALWGLGIGAASGMAVAGGDPEALHIPLVFSGIGAVIGAVIGSGSPNRLVIYESPVSGATN